MSKKIKLPISSSVKLLVDEGDEVTSGKILWTEEKSSAKKIIHLAHLIDVQPKDILKYLKKKIGEKVFSGELIAEKKSFFSTLSVRSPIAGVIQDIDLKKGTLTLASEEKSFARKISLPISGRILSIGKDYLEIEVENEVLLGEKGGGNDVEGELFYFNLDRVDLFDIKDEVEKCIIFVKKISKHALIKLEVLGGTGLIIQNFDELVEEDIPISWIKVGDLLAKKLSSFDKKRVWLRPSMGEIIVL